MFDLFTCKKIINLKTETFNDGPKTIFDFIFWILGIFLWIYAIMLAWQCNKEKGGIEKIVMVIIAFIIPYLYLISYFIYHKLLGYPCNN